MASKKTTDPISKIKKLQEQKSKFDAEEKALLVGLKSKQESLKNKIKAIKKGIHEQVGREIVQAFQYDPETGKGKIEDLQKIITKLEEYAKNNVI